MTRPNFSPANAVSRIVKWVNASTWRHMGISLGTVGAIAALVLLPVWGHRDTSPRAAIQPPHVLPAVARDPDSADASRFRTFALNALLIPVLDDDVPSRWMEPFALMHCVKADLMIDGNPVIFGSPVPWAAFSMHWSMDQCTALGEALVMSGTVDLLVFHDGDSYSAVVQPSNLRVESPSGTMVLTQSFAASTPLGDWSAANSPLQIASSRWQSRSNSRRVPKSRSDHGPSRVELPSVSLTRVRHHQAERRWRRCPPGRRWRICRARSGAVNGRRHWQHCWLHCTKSSVGIRIRSRPGTKVSRN